MGEYDVCVCVTETCSHGTGGPSDHCYAVHTGTCEKPKDRPTGMFPSVLLQDKGAHMSEQLLKQCVCVVNSDELFPDTVCVCVCQTADQQYQDAFNDELASFKERVRGRAKVRIEKAMKEYEEEERQKRLGPGGLDPVEVYDTLPQVKRAHTHLRLWRTQGGSKT